MNDVVQSFGLNLAAGLVSSLIVLYLDQHGLTTPAYIVFGLYVVIASLIFVRAIRRPKPIGAFPNQRESAVNGDVNSDVQGNDLDVFHSILALVAKHHSQEIPATPKRIAADLGLDPEITLAHMWKYHNEQFITFRNDGKRPELDTPFFLSPRAWERIKVVRA